MTYGGQGVGKLYVKKSDHAIIYSGRNPPASMSSERPARGELGMRSYAIRVDPDKRDEKLDPMSRIDFGKMHTIHHNLKVRPFGMVNDNSISHLLSQFEAVMKDSSSRRQSKRSSRANIPSTSSDTTVRDYVYASGSSKAPQRRAPQHEVQEEDEDSSGDGESSDSEDGETNENE